MPPKTKKRGKTPNGATLGFEASYKHVVFGLIFLKYISDRAAGIGGRVPCDRRLNRP